MPCEIWGCLSFESLNPQPMISGVFVSLLHGLNPNELLAECFHHRYAAVFMLDPLPFQPDDQRVEEVAAIAAYTGEWLARDYAALGYSILRVPVLSPEERLTFVLERLSEQGLL